MKPFNFTRNFCLISASLLVIFAKVDALALGPRSTEKTDPILEELQHVLKSSNTSIYDITTPTFRDDWPASAEKRKDRIRRGFTDALILAYYGQEAAQEAVHNVLTSPFLDYFPTALATGVDNVFTNVVRSQMGTGNDEYISKIFFKYEDTDGICKKHPDWAAYNKPTGPGAGADSDIVICERGWAVKDMRVPHRKCENLGDRVSEATMESFGRVVLHEILHLKLIGENAKGVGDPITDISDEFYGVCGTRKLRKKDQGMTKLNDDNYAWLAQEYYWQDICNKSKQFGEPTC